MLRKTWHKSRNGFFWRLGVLLSLVLLMGLGIDAWQMAQRWLRILPFAYCLSFILFADVRRFRWSGVGGSRSDGRSDSGGGFSSGCGSSGGGASGSW